MNQARTTYQVDYSSFGWFENNFMSDLQEFCSTDNVDDCLKFLSQEFSALGYPPIYSTSSDCPFSINCDIVKLLNVTFDLLRNCNEHNQNKENLEDRNQRLSSDLTVLHRKNSQMKNIIEQLEKKLVIVLERERQLNERSEQLSQLLKTEKEETKRLTAQLSKQKLAYQHDLRKNENDLNHIKNKLNQLLADKITSKKLATISMSQPLPRNNGQRGMWKNSSSASSAAEDMYNTVISNFEIRTKQSYKEVLSYRQYLQSVLLQVADILTLVQSNEVITSEPSLSEEIAMSFLSNECQSIESFDEKFKHLFSALKEQLESKLSHKSIELGNEAVSLKSENPEHENCVMSLADSQKDIDLSKSSTASEEVTEKSSCEKGSTEGKNKLDEKKLLSVKSLESIEKLLSEMSDQKLAVFRLKMQQSQNPTYQGLSTLPLVSVVTSRDGSKKVSSLNRLKASSSSPDHFAQSLPFWGTGQSSSCNTLPSNSDTILLRDQTADEVFLPSCETGDVHFSPSDLPSWAVSETPNFDVRDSNSKTLETYQHLSTDETELVSEPSSEENFLKLKAAVQDIEQKKSNMS